MMWLKFYLNVKKLFKYLLVWLHSRCAGHLTARTNPYSYTRLGLVISRGKVKSTPWCWCPFLLLNQPPLYATSIPRLTWRCYAFRCDGSAIRGWNAGVTCNGTSVWGLRIYITPPILTLLLPFISIILRIKNIVLILPVLSAFIIPVLSAFIIL